MIRATKVWEYYSYELSLRKKYGSKRSGRIYIVADSPDEASQIVLDMYAQAGLVADRKKPLVEESNLVKQALRMIY